MFKSGNSGLSAEATKKYELENKNDENDEEYEDEDYTYEYVDEDEEEISDAEFSDNETLNNKDIEKKNQEKGKNENDTKKNENFDKKKEETKENLEKNIETNKTTELKNNSKESLKTELKKTEQQKNLKETDTKLTNSQRQESDPPIQQKKVNIENIGNKIKSQNTTDLDKNLESRKARSKSVVIDENLNTIKDDDGIELAKIKNDSSTAQIKKESNSASNSCAEKPTERASRTAIPPRSFVAAKSIWEARTSSNPPPITRVNETINKDPWLRATSRAAEFEKALRSASIEPTDKRSKVTLPIKKNEIIEAGKSPQSAREKILAEMQKNAHIAAKPTFAIAGVKPKPKPPPPPPPPPPPKFLETKLKEKPDLMETSAAKVSIGLLKPTDKKIETKKINDELKTQTQKEENKSKINANKLDDKIKKEETVKKENKKNEEIPKQSEKSKSETKEDANDEEDLADEECEFEDEESDLDDEEEIKVKKDEEKIKNKKNKSKKKKRRKVVKICKKLKKKKPKTKVEETKIKRKWIPPPRPPPEVYLMPPNEKRIYQINKDDCLRPVKRYAKRAKKEVIIPFVIPWEQTATLNGQGGMGAFGTHRDPKINIEDGNVKLVQGELKSETLLPLFEENTKKFASQKGLTSFGSHRKNVDNIIDGHVYKSSSKQNLCESVIPRTMLGLLTDQSNMTPFGSLRNQALKVEYSKGMTEGVVPESNTFLSRQFRPNQSESAGSHITNCRRQIVQSGQPIKASQISESIVPKIFSNDKTFTKSGAEFGAFRPLIHESIGGYKMSYDEERLCKLVIPYQTAPSLK